MYDSSATVQRAHLRHPFGFDAKVLLDDIGPYLVSTVNLSQDGVCLVSQRALAIGRNYAIAITVPNSSRRINAWGTVVYCDVEPDAFYAGIRFVDMDAYSRTCITDLLSLPANAY